MKYKSKIVSMLNSIDPDELISVQSLFKGLVTLDDRDTYLKSIADAVIGYPIEDLKIMTKLF